MKHIVASIIGAAILLTTSTTLAQNVERFVVRVASNPIAINEAVDITVQAVDARGEVVKTYDGDIFMEVDTVREADVVLPADGVYTFQAVDQGAKIFNKGLVFKKEGTYTFRVYEVLDTKREGTVEIVVKGNNAGNSTQSVVVTSPTSGGIEQNSTINIIGESKFPNSPIEFYVDSKKVHDTITEADGSFSTYLSQITVGTHSLVVKVVDIDGNLMGESDPTIFSYQTADLNLYKSIVLTPTTPEQDQIITATVTTLDTVSNVQLYIDGQSYIMDKVDTGVFTKSFKISEQGEYTIDLDLTAGDNTRTYQKVKTITVTTSTAGITSVKYNRDTKNLDLVSLQWTIKGDFNSYRVQYGTDKNALTQTITSTTTSTQATLSANQTYYIQVQGLDLSGQPKGSASIVVEVPAMHGSAGSGSNTSTCKVDGIVLSAIKSGDNYLITWPNIAGVDKYTIYQSDKAGTPIAQSIKVAETVQNYFPYPFDPKATKETYTYYTVVATCADGTTITVEESKKIQVGPMQNFALIALAGMLIYGSYRFTRVE